MGGGEVWFDVDGEVGEALESALHFGTDHDHAVKKVFGAGVIAFGLNGEDFAGERNDGRFQLLEIEGEGAVGVRGDGAGIEVPVELERHALRVSGADAEAQRAECRGEEGGIHRALLGLVDDAGVHEKLQSPEAGDIGFRLFEAAVELAEFGADGGLATVDFDGLRPEPVHKLVHEDVGEERIERDVRLVGGSEDAFRDRNEHMRELRFLGVFQHHAFRAFLGDDTLVVGEIKGGGLDAAVGVAGAEDEIDDANRRVAAKLRAAVARIEREIVFELLQVLAETGEFGGLGLVGDGDERFESGFEIEPFVLVNLVGPDGGFDRRVEFHPRDIAVVVVVVEEGGGAFFEEGFERGLRGGIGGLAEEAGGVNEFVLIFEAVRNGGEATVGRAANDREEAGGGGVFIARERVQPSVDFLAGGVGGVEVGARRFRADAGEERRVVIETGPRAGVETEVVEPGAAERRGVAHEGGELGFVERGDLAKEDRVEDAGGVDHARERGAFVGGKMRDVGGEFDRHEAGVHLAKALDVGKRFSRREGGALDQGGEDENGSRQETHEA